MLTVDDFDFVLPPELIAQHPLGRRSDSRLLFLGDGCLEDRFFKDLPVFLQPGDLLIFNDAKVIKARFLGHKTSGGRVEVLLERIIDEMTALVQMRVSKSPQPGSRIELEGAFSATVESRADGFFYLKLSDGDWWSLAERFGRLPLPPYITHEPVPEDEERYQTVFARMPGAVAAPTAGLHFDEELLLRLAEKGIRSARLTLYVGAGTFQPVRVKNLADHHMHYERYEISDETIAEIEKTRRSGCKVVAVGTTTLRALEAAASGSENGLPRAGAGETNLFITPGFTFRIVDRLLTNFHLPRSTLLMLVAAFAGTNEIKRAYMHAVEARYRFFSYGDAMLLDRAAPNLHLKNNV